MTATQPPGLYVPEEATGATCPDFSPTRRPGYTQRVVYRPTFRPAHVAYARDGASISELSAVLRMLERRGRLWR